MPCLPLGGLPDTGIKRGSSALQADSVLLPDLGGSSEFNSEKAMAPYSSTLAWHIPWAEEPGRLQSMGWLRVGHD